MPTPEEERKIIAKKRKRGEDLTVEEQLAEARREAQDSIARRIKMRNAILKQFAPLLTGTSPPMEGALGKAAHIASMQPEAVAAMLLTDLIIFIAQLICNTPYIIQKGQFNQLLQKQLSEMAKGNDIQLVYMPDENGVWPTVYKVDEEGEIDFTQEYENGKAPRDAVRRNGLVPVPSFSEGYLNAMNLHMERMWGQGILTDDQKLQLRNMIDEVGPEARNAADRVRDQTMFQRMNMMRPKPGGPGG